MNQRTRDDYLRAKVIIVGDSTVGKSSIVLRFCNNEFNEYQGATIGVDFIKRTVEIDCQKVEIQIWDTGGQERLSNLANQYFKGASGIILTYAIDNLESFQRIQYWIDQVNETSDDADTCKILVGNKIDLPEDERVVTKKEGEDAAAKYKIDFFEISAKTGENVDEAFYYISRVILNKNNNKRAISVENLDNVVLNPHPIPKVKKDDNRCCK